jgi:hypothetical protein
MKVYAGKDVYNKKNLVGIIYESGEVYAYSNGQEELFGKVESVNFYIYGKDKRKIYTGNFSNIPTMGGGGKINIGEYLHTEMMGFYNSGEFFVGSDIEDESNMIGFRVGDFLHGMSGSYVAAWMLIFNYHYSK